ncbi:MAG: GerMN domain-containing protein [Roseburia sp.]|nr:GerMN domain-containing protein [Roseburia sp.]
MKKKLFFLLLLVLTVLMTACEQEEQVSGYHIEYLNNEKDAIVKVPYEPENTEKEALIKELLIVLWSDSENVEYRKPIPNDVELIKYSLDGAMLTLWLDEDYNKMNEIEKVLSCAAVVRTMTQVEGIDCVTFYVGDSQLTDAQGNLIGTLYADSFVENPGAQINSIQDTTLTLYFSNKDGDALIAETRNVHYSSNMSMEKLIMEQLLGGPETEGLKSAIPAGTKLVSVSLVDGTCYVNLDATFKNQDYAVMEPIVIYSIVNSLSEVSAISQVQISVNGDTSGAYRDTYQLSEMYVRNLDYVTTLEAEATEETEVTESTEDISDTEEPTGTEATENTLDAAGNAANTR